MTNKKCIPLNENSFLYQTVRYGYFAEQFPDCFTSETLSLHIDELLPFINLSKKCSEKGSSYTTSPTTLSTYKNDISRRVLSVPNPLAFLRTVKYIKDNWERVKGYSKSANSLSPITFITSYDASIDEELINCESIREDYRAKSDFIQGLHECIRVSLGYKYRLCLDISNCYNSIYTHSITWAICGKNDAKQYFRTNEPAELKEDYEIGNCLDALIRYQKNNETNGIIVGPFTSRIASEVILARIDKDLRDKGYIFKRYVDDFKFYFRTEAEAISSLPIIESVLNEYNLSLNTSKTEIKKYPYESNSYINKAFKAAFTSDGIVGVLDTASSLFVSGEKGAYKYALKFIQNENIPQADKSIIIPTLINIMLIDPRYGKYITKYIKRNLSIIDSKDLETIFNNELSTSLNNQLQQESLLFIQLLNDLNIRITGDNILKAINSKNDFVIIIALDIWKNRKSTVDRDKTTAEKINKAIASLVESLSGEKLSGSRWLLLYEMISHNLAEKEFLNTIEVDDFFKKMLNLGISFYNSQKQI